MARQSRQKSRRHNRQQEREQQARLEKIEPKSYNQKLYFNSIRDNTYTFVVGPAGTGKSFIPLYIGLTKLYKEEIEKIIFIRPLIEVNNFFEKSLGALPGDIKGKLAGWNGGVQDNLAVLIPDDRERQRLIDSSKIEFLPLSLCRGRTFHNTFVIVEEAQNVSLEGEGMKMILTRLGENSKMIIAGDIEQKDTGKRQSALQDAITRFSNTEQFGIIELEKSDIVRNTLISIVLEKYEEKK
jgi:phosphate starvation-inducible PhoH-like protein